LFIKACQENDLEKVKACFLLGIDANTLSSDSQASGLSIAAEKNFLELLNILLSQTNINVNISMSQNTPLSLACSKGNHDIVRRLLQMPGINIVHKNGNGETALHLASKYSHKCVLELAQVRGLDWSEKTNSGYTPLYMALEEGNVEAVRTIISLPGIDFKATTKEGKSLAEAVVTSDRGKNVECMKLMLGVPAVDWNVTIKESLPTVNEPSQETAEDAQKRVLLLIDLERQRLEGRQAIRPRPRLVPPVRAKKSINESSLLMWCATNEKNIKFQLLADCPRVNLNVKNASGDTISMWTLKNNKPDFYKMLIKTSRLDLNIKDSSGDTMALWALKNNKLDILKHLLDTPSLDVNVTDANGNTLMKIAKGRDLQEILELLPGTMEYKVKQLEEAMKRKIPECPICLQNFQADTRIFQCINGHVLCEECKNKLVRKVCPTCKLNVDGRAHYFEDFLRN